MTRKEKLFIAVLAVFGLALLVSILGHRDEGGEFESIAIGEGAEKVYWSGSRELSR